MVVVLAAPHETPQDSHELQGMELVSIRRIQGFGYGVLEFLGVGTTNVDVVNEGFENLIASGLSSNVMCVRRGEVLRNPFFITEVDEDAIPEFSTIVNSELFDFDVILIFNSFDEGHDSFRCLTFLLQEVYPGVP
ncbi:hypothetical protein Tco_1208111 [Tanacetum coccineum]